MGTLWQDVKYGARMLARNPAFTVVAVITLALGIGANAAIFKVADDVLFRPLPVEHPERLVQLTTVDSYGVNTVFNYSLYKDYRDQNEGFDALACYSSEPMSLSTGGQSERIYGLVVSGNYFSLLRVQPALGRFFAPDEDQTPLAHPVVVLSHGLWQRRFGADPKIVGNTIGLNGHRFIVVGVAPADFRGTIRGYAPDVYAPMMMQAWAAPVRDSDPLTFRGYTWLSVIGRLRPGINREQAQVAMRALAARIKSVAPMNTSTDIVLADGSKGDAEVVSELSKPVLLLLAMVGLVLLIACANIAGLLLLRAADRAKEIAVRLAIGAGRVRLLRQLLTESILLSALGGAAGLLLAVWMMDVLPKFHAPVSYVPMTLSPQFDLRVLGFTALLSVVTGIVFGMVPALQATRPNLVAALKSETREARGYTSWFSLRNLLTVVQVALSLMVLVGAGLCVRSLRNLVAVDAGFEPNRVLVMSLDLMRNGYDEARGQQFYAQLMERVGGLPGVESASYASIVPLGGNGMRWQPIGIEGYTTGKDEFPAFDFNVVGADYFRTMGVPLLLGREFGPQDTAKSPPVVLINEAAAQRYFPGQNPVGRHLLTPVWPPGSPPKSYEIIGLVKDTKYRSLTDTTAPALYIALSQHYRGNVALHVRMAGNAELLTGAIRREVWSLDASLPVFNVMKLEERKAESLYISRMATTVLAAFGSVGLLLATVGIYGVVAGAVRQRTREIGVRMALGARPRDVLRMVLEHGLILTLAGLVIGLGGALGLTRFLKALLFGVQPTDPLTIVAASGLLAAVALAACWIPAQRAARVDPMVVLRYE